MLKYFNLEEVAPLIPKVTLVPLQMVLPQQGAQFLLETHFRMMLLLVPNVVRYLIMAWAINFGVRAQLLQS